LAALAAGAAALIYSVTVMPVMASLFLARRMSVHDTLLARGLKAGYEPLLRFAMRAPVPQRTLLRFPQVDGAISETGGPEIANDPMGVHHTGCGRSS
jgi:hypothetical protein